MLKFPTTLAFDITAVATASSGRRANSHTLKFPTTLAFDITAVATASSGRRANSHTLKIPTTLASDITYDAAASPGCRENSLEIKLTVRIASRASTIIRERVRPQERWANSRRKKIRDGNRGATHARSQKYQHAQFSDCLVPTYINAPTTSDSGETTHNTTV